MYYTEPTDSSTKLYVSQFLFLILAYIFEIRDSSERTTTKTSTSLIWCSWYQCGPIRSMTWKNLLSLLTLWIWLLPLIFYYTTLAVLQLKWQNSIIQINDTIYFAIVPATERAGSAIRNSTVNLRVLEKVVYLYCIENKESMWSMLCEVQ